MFFLSTRGATVLALTLIAIALLLSPGCATSRESTEVSGPVAACHVCQYHNDLACLCVKVTDRTPMVEYQGTNYSFCSQDCRADFLKKPEKYLPQP